MAQLYEIDPVEEWHVGLDLEFRLKPWQMGSLTPFQLEAYLKAYEIIVQSRS